MRNVLYKLRCETGAAPSGARGSARTEPLRIKDDGNFGVDVVVEQPINEFNDIGRCLHHLPGGLRVDSGESRGLSAPEAEIDPGSTIARNLCKSRVFNQVGEHSLALTVRCRR